MGADPQSRDARPQRFAHFTELAIISVQELVDFAKQVPGFLQLGREDQIALLKASTIEVTTRLQNRAEPSAGMSQPLWGVVSWRVQWAGQGGKGTGLRWTMIEDIKWTVDEEIRPKDLRGRDT